MNVQLPAPIRPSFGAIPANTITVIDQYGNVRMSPDCGSGEGGACDTYNQPPIGSSGDFAGEVFNYITDAVGGGSSVSNKPSVLGGNGVILGSLLFVGVLMIMNRGGR